MRRYGAKIHVNGVGGKGMAPAAALAHLAGYAVSGDDLRPNHRTSILSEAGITVELGQNSQGPIGTDTVVSTSAMSPAKSLANQPHKITRLELVNSVFEDLDKKQISISGSFGKSSAASLMYSTLSTTAASCYIGADVPNTLCGAAIGGGEIAITEACEYRDAYLAVQPWMAVLLNTFENHEDFFGPGTRGFEQSFADFVNSRAGALEHVVLGEDVASGYLSEHETSPNIHRVGFAEYNNWRVRIRSSDAWGSDFEVCCDSNKLSLGTFKVPATGLHIVKAAAVAVVAATVCGVSAEVARRGLAEAVLPDRRLSVRYDLSSVAGIDDNGRHATQVTALVDALRQRWPLSKICLVASPWGRRNPRNLTDWAAAMGQADAAIILPVGDASTSAGGAELPEAAQLLENLISRKGVSAWAVESEGQAAEIACKLVQAGPHVVLATVGYDSSQEVFDAFHRAVRDLCSSQV